jgi:hypothetical protein
LSFVSDAMFPPTSPIPADFANSGMGQMLRQRQTAKAEQLARHIAHRMSDEVIAQGVKGYAQLQAALHSPQPSPCSASISMCSVDAPDVAACASSEMDDGSITQSDPPSTSSASVYMSSLSPSPKASDIVTDDPMSAKSLDLESPSPLPVHLPVLDVETAKMHVDTHTTEHASSASDIPLVASPLSSTETSATPIMSTASSSSSSFSSAAAVVVDDAPGAAVSVKVEAAMRAAGQSQSLDLSKFGKVRVSAEKSLCMYLATVFSLAWRGNLNDPTTNVFNPAHPTSQDLHSAMDFKSHIVALAQQQVEQLYGAGACPAECEHCLNFRNIWGQQEHAELFLFLMQHGMKGLENQNVQSVLQQEPSLTQRASDATSGAEFAVISASMPQHGTVPGVGMHFLIYGTDTRDDTLNLTINSHPDREAGLGTVMLLRSQNDQPAVTQLPPQITLSDLSTCWSCSNQNTVVQKTACPCSPGRVSGASVATLSCANCETTLSPQHFKWRGNCGCGQKFDDNVQTWVFVNAPQPLREDEHFDALVPLAFASVLESKGIIVEPLVPTRSAVPSLATRGTVIGVVRWYCCFWLLSVCMCPCKCARGVTPRIASVDVPVCSYR